MKEIKILFIFLFITIVGFSQSLGIVDSLNQELNREGVSDTLKTKILLHLGYYSNSPEESLDYGTKALMLAQKIGFKKYEANAYAQIGNSERLLGNNIEGTEALIKSANLYREIGMFYHEAYALSSIGAAFLNDKDFENSLKYFRQGLVLFLECQDTLYISNSLLNIGEVYRILEQSDSAEFYFLAANEKMKSVKNDNKYEYDQLISTIEGNLGMVHFKQGKLPQAKTELKNAIDYFKAQNDPYRTSVYKCDMGKILILEGQINEGEKRIKESLEMAKKALLKEQIRDFSLELSSFYENQDLPEKALYFHKQYKVYDDSLKNVENVRKMEKLQSQLALGKKEEEITALSKINQLQRKLGYALLVGALISTVFFFFLFQTNRKIKFQNKKITEQSLIVEKREQEKALLLKELNHRVKNNLQMVASLLNLHSRQLKDHPAAEALMEGKYRVEALTLIHQKLYRDDVDTKINIKEYIEELASNLVLNFGQGFQLELNMDTFIMKIDKAIPLGLIINELVTNSLKYGHENNESPRLKIGVKNKTTKLIITIEDNGVGLPSDFDFRHTASFGLKLVHSLVKQLGGIIEWKSVKGTQWKLALDTLKIS